jgi:protein-S-isoprenylcysteine O-methyltransferase Ste14
MIGDHRWQAVTVLGLATAYWAAALVKAVHFRRRTGLSAHPWPKPKAERLLMVAWVANILVWVGQPVAFLAGPKPWTRGDDPLAALTPVWEVPALEFAGVALGAVALAVSVLAWAQMGDSWRLGTTKPGERTELVDRGVFGLVRHPIYAAQGWLVAGCVLMLPTPISLALGVVHFACLYAKAAIEERHLLAEMGEPYERYRRRVGGFFPKLSGLPTAMAGLLSARPRRAGGDSP